MTSAPRRSRALTAFRALGTGLMAIALSVLVVIGLAAIVVPALTGSTALTVMTSSMEPDFPPGTLVVVRPTDPAEIAPGAIITYQLRSGEPTLVTHRVTQQRLTADGGYLFTTQGDANPNPDPGFVTDAQLVGTVWYAVPYVGWVSQVVTGEVRAIVIPVVAGGLGVYALWMIIAGIRERPRRGTAGAKLASSFEPDATDPTSSTTTPDTLPTRRSLRARTRESSTTDAAATDDTTSDAPTTGVSPAGTAPADAHATTTADNASAPSA